MNNADKPITPLRGAEGGLFESSGIDVSYIESCKPLIGLTKREHFAGLAMQGYLSMLAWSDGLGGGHINPSAEEVAAESVSYADALLKELEKGVNMK